MTPMEKDANGREVIGLCAERRLLVSFKSVCMDPLSAIASWFLPWPFSQGGYLWSSEPVCDDLLSGP
jgi:hypothetical protein